MSNWSCITFLKDVLYIYIHSMCVLNNTVKIGDRLTSLYFVLFNEHYQSVQKRLELDQIVRKSESHVYPNYLTLKVI